MKKQSNNSSVKMSGKTVIGEVVSERGADNTVPLIWHTEKRKVKDLVPTEGNPRQMTEKQAKDLQASLEKFNLVDIPAINTDNRIVSGHQRITILKILGRGNETIDVRIPNRKLTEEEHREYLIRANRNLGEWNMDLLANFDENLLFVAKNLEPSRISMTGNRYIAHTTVI